MVRSLALELLTAGGMSSSGAKEEPRLLDRVRESLRVRHMSYRTEQAYVHWIRRYILFHGKRHPREMGEGEVNAFLTHLAVEKRVSASTQTQALCALICLYRTVLARELGELDGLIRARRRRRLPVVLTRDEVKRLLARLAGAEHLFFSLLYGTGMRLSEGLRLRVKDVDFSTREITVRDGKGGKDRKTVLPDSVKSPFQVHLREVRQLHQRDLEAGGGQARPAARKGASVESAAYGHGLRRALSHKRSGRCGRGGRLRDNSPELT